MDLQQDKHALISGRENNERRRSQLVRQYDGKCGVKYIQKFCDYIGITLEDFGMLRKVQGTIGRGITLENVN